jgi:hypothetical protein
MFVFQTPQVSKQASTMNYALGVIVLALIILVAVGRPPKQVLMLQLNTLKNYSLKI